jgi:hypothetical protein
MVPERPPLCVDVWILICASRRVGRGCALRRVRQRVQTSPGSLRPVCESRAALIQVLVVVPRFLFGSLHRERGGRDSIVYRDKRCAVDGDRVSS